mmetsp:Transcript_16803/g.53205  ORF Transcript_16803/g.53205 Transcript_16803/m.53205 type:complete len:202 (+) Transcript_16803:515-1120(+)
MRLHRRHHCLDAPCLSDATRAWIAVLVVDVVVDPCKAVECSARPLLHLDAAPVRKHCRHQRLCDNPYYDELFRTPARPTALHFNPPKSILSQIQQQLLPAAVDRIPHDKVHVRSVRRLQLRACSEAALHHRGHMPRHEPPQPLGREGRARRDAPFRAKQRLCVEGPAGERPAQQVALGHVRGDDIDKVSVAQHLCGGGKDG